MQWGLFGSEEISDTEIFSRVFVHTSEDKH